MMLEIWILTDGEDDGEYNGPVFGGDEQIQVISQSIFISAH